MIGAFIKSLIFNIVFYSYTLVICVLLSFTFILPRRLAFTFVRVFYFRAIYVIERIFLGLDYRILGRENLPQHGSYILALKHYSAYETLKLPILFGDIAIIMKQELTWIPLWGWYTIKLGMISVDRGGRNKALASLIENSKRVIADERPILIFPQGTRVNPDDTTQEKPYKVGIAKIAETLNLPVVPVALNSGAFWPKHGFIKKSGVVDFKILPMIPAGLSTPDMLKRLEAVLEPESQALMDDAEVYAKRKFPRGMKTLLVLGVVLYAAWYGWWHFCAYMLQQRFDVLPQTISSPYKPSIDGFPGPLDILWPEVTYQNNTTTVNFPVAEALVWPLPLGGVELIAPQGFAMSGQRDGQSVQFAADSFNLHFTLPALWKPQAQWMVTVKSVDVSAGNTVLSGDGRIEVPLQNAPVNGALGVTVRGYKDLMGMLTDNNMIDEDKARMATSFMDAMATAQGGSGTLAFPLSIKDDVLYLSMIRLVNLAEMRGTQGPGSFVLPQRSRSGGSETNVLPGLDPQMLNPALPQEP